MQESATTVQLLFNLILWLLIYMLVRPANQYPYRLKHSSFVFACVLIVIFTLFPYWGGDYFHYKQQFNDYKGGGFIPLEEYYKWLIDNIGFSYTIFRFFVWCPALVLLFSAYKKTHVNLDLILFYFAVLYLMTFSYARASLAMSTIIYGLTFWGCSRKFISLNNLFGLFIIVLSFLFHKSAIIGIVASLIALFLLKPNKSKIITIAICFPLLIGLVVYLLGQFMDLELTADTMISANHREAYLNDEDVSGFPGWGPYIHVLLSRVPLLCMPLLYIQLVFNGSFILLDKCVRLVLSYGFVLSLISIVFLFDLGVNTYVFYYRTLNYTILPSALLLSVIKQNNIKIKYRDVIYTASFIGVIYTLIYRTYCTLF